MPEIKLDDVFQKKDEIASVVKTELSEVMDDFGYGIVKALVTDIDPDAKVKEAMNQVNASARLKEAAKNEAEANKIRTIAEAEASQPGSPGSGTKA